MSLPSVDGFETMRDLTTSLPPLLSRYRCYGHHSDQIPYALMPIKPTSVINANKSAKSLVRVCPAETLCSILKAMLEDIIECYAYIGETS
jgi:hypothetical protein